MLIDLELLSSLAPLGLLIAVMYAHYKGCIVWGWGVPELQRERDEWREVAHKVQHNYEVGALQAGCSHPVAVPQASDNTVRCLHCGALLLRALDVMPAELLPRFVKQGPPKEEYPMGYVPPAPPPAAEPTRHFPLSVTLKNVLVLGGDLNITVTGEDGESAVTISNKPRKQAPPRPDPNVIPLGTKPDSLTIREWCEQEGLVEQAVLVPRWFPARFYRLAQAIVRADSSTAFMVGYFPVLFSIPLALLILSFWHFWTFVPLAVTSAYGMLFALLRLYLTKYNARRRLEWLDE